MAGGGKAKKKRKRKRKKKKATVRHQGRTVPWRTVPCCCRYCGPSSVQLIGPSLTRKEGIELQAGGRMAGWAGRRARRVGAHVGCRPSGPWSDRKARGTGRLCLLDQGQGLQGQSGRSGAALSQPDSQSSSSLRPRARSQGGPFLALLPSSLSPSPGRKGGAAASCCVLWLRAARCCARLRTVCSPSERAGVCVRGAGVQLAPPAPGWLAGSSFFFLLLYPSPRCLPVAALSFSLLSIVNPSPSVHPTDSSLNRQTLFPPLLFFPPRFFMF